MPLACTRDRRSIGWALGLALVLGAAPAEAFVRSMESVEIVLGTSDLSKTVNLNLSQNGLNCVPFATSMGDASAGGFGTMFTDVYVTPGSPATVTVERGVTGGTVTVLVHVVEFEPADVQVQQGTFSIGSGTAGPVNVGITAVDTGRAALVFYGKNDIPGTNQGYDRAMVEGRFSGAGSQVQFQRGSSGNTIDGHWHVFEALNNSGYAFSVQPRTFSFSGPTGSSGVSSVSPDLSFVVGSYLVSASGRDPDEAHYRLNLSCAASCTSIQASSNSGTSVSVTGYAITFASGITVRRGTFNYPLGSGQQTATLSPAVLPTKTMAWTGFGYAPGVMEVEGSGMSDIPMGQQHVRVLDATNIRGTRGMTGEIAIGPWEAVEWTNATEVTLTSFDAVPLDGAVELSWETASELENLGFHVYRSATREGPYLRITDAMIPGLGSSPTGASYHFRDEDVTNGQTVFYELEDVESSGVTTRHGPVEATPQPRSTSSDGEPDDSPIAYGEPDASTLSVNARGRRSVVVELTTRGFYADVSSDGTAALRIPDFVSNGSLVPVRRRWLDAITGRRVRIVSVEASDVETIAGFRPASRGMKLIASRDGTVGLASTPRAKDSGSGPWARIVDVGFQGDVKKVLVELAPLRWDPASRTLLLARRLSVRLTFAGREPGERLTSGGRGRKNPRGRVRSPRTVTAQLGTTHAGLHAVDYEDVFRGRRRFRIDRLRLSRGGEAVAFHVEPARKWFAPGSTLLFLSEGESANPYGSEAVYELELKPGGARMVDERVSVWGSPVGSYRERLEREESQLYQAGLLEAPDLWLWDYFVSPQSRDYAFDVSGLARGPSTLRARLQGASDAYGTLDHRVRFYVNGTFVDETSWDGKRPHDVASVVPDGVLRDGENVLTIDSTGGVGAPVSAVMLDRYSLEYSRVPDAVSGRLEGTFVDSGVVAIGGLASPPHLLDVTEPVPRWLNGARIGRDGKLRFRAEAGHRYLATSADAVHRPVVRKAKPTRWLSSRHRADYVVVGPRAFLDAARPLLELRRKQGLRVAAVSVEAIATEFGFGESTPDAIRAFVAHAYHEWREPSLRYLLLLGDATYDFKDNLQTGRVNFVAPRIVKTSFLWTASDPSYGAVNGSDPLPDVAVGRLPAASVQDVHTMVAKIIAYERRVQPLDDKVVLVADDPDGAGNFNADAADIVSRLPAGHDVETILLSELGTPAARQAVIDAFNEGSSVVSYVGHGGISLWATENIFSTGALSALGPQERQPIVLTMNCLNGFFHFPFVDALSEALVKLERGGAIAAFSPSGLSFNDPAHQFHEALIDALLNDEHARLGDAVLAAQIAYSETGAFPELLTIYHLFGDPALRLR